jgi:hypothetical protein
MSLVALPEQPIEWLAACQKKPVEWSELAHLVDQNSVLLVADWSQRPYFGGLGRILRVGIGLAGRAGRAGRAGPHASAGILLEAKQQSILEYLQKHPRTQMSPHLYSQREPLDYQVEVAD